jgi:hypothetical protein
MTSANKGKDAESAVQAYLKAYDEKHANFDWKRNYDSHTAGGRFQKVSGDFEYFMPGRYGIIEVKEVKHDYRLPASNFENAPKIRKRQMAGGRCFVAVRHSTTGLWRLASIDFFVPGVPSWDMSQLPTYARVGDALGWIFESLEG